MRGSSSLDVKAQRGGNSMRACLIFAVALAATVLKAHPGAAEMVVAIGFSQGGPTKGWVYGQSSGADAATVALNICRGIDKTNNVIPTNPSAAQKNCGIVATLSNHCFAISSNGTQTTSPTGFSWAVAPDSIAANRQALANCQIMKGPADAPCTIRGSGCDGSAK
jgi:hypothetical protein